MLLNFRRSTPPSQNSANDNQRAKFGSPQPIVLSQNWIGAPAKREAGLNILRKPYNYTAVHVCTAQPSEAGGFSFEGTRQQTGASEGKSSCSFLNDGAEA